MHSEFCLSSSLVHACQVGHINVTMFKNKVCLRRERFPSPYAFSYHSLKPHPGNNPWQVEVSTHIYWCQYAIRTHSRVDGARYLEIDDNTQKQGLVSYSFVFRFESPLPFTDMHIHTAGFTDLIRRTEQVLRRRHREKKGGRGEERGRVFLPPNDSIQRRYPLTAQKRAMTTLLIPEGENS